MAIIAILAAMLLPALGQVKETAVFPQNTLAFFRREETLDIGYDKNQYAEQYRDFYGVIKKEL